MGTGARDVRRTLRAPDASPARSADPAGPVRARASGVTPIDASARRLLPGLKLTEYHRTKGSSATTGVDTIEAELAAPVLKPAGRNPILIAALAPAPPPGEPASGAAALEKAAASEFRKLSIDKNKNKDLGFYYPYLSRGKITSLEVDEQRNVTGTGVIKPSIRFLGDLNIAFGPNRLELVQDINTDAINASPAIKPVSLMFRFVSGQVGVDLVKFKPHGTLEFEVGPKSKPVILGTVHATEEGGAFVATGALQPAASIPGITAAKGEVTYRSDTGWSGLLTATSSSIPNATTNVKLGFKETKGGKFDPFGEGSISTKVRDSELGLKVRWEGGAIQYHGSVTVRDPIPPLVKRVDLKGVYANQTLLLTGDAEIKWKGIDSKMHVTYRRQDGDPDGKFSGKADVQVKEGKALGVISLSFDEEGRFWGGGSLTYQITNDIRPKLGVEITKERKIKLLGEVAIADMALTRMWPPPAGGNLTFIKGIGGKFSVPLPVPGITAYGEIKVSAGLKYGVGPVMVRGVVFVGELFPFEDDPQVKARLKGKLVVPAFGEIYGLVEAYVGAEVAGGLVGAKGGVKLWPALRIEGEGGLNVDAEYLAGAFSFSAEAYAVGRLILKLRIDLAAEIYAGYGLWSHTWTWNVKDFQKQVGPELRLTLGKISYGKDGEITWPSLSQVKLDPPDLDPRPW